MIDAFIALAFASRRRCRVRLHGGHHHQAPRGDRDAAHFDVYPRTGGSCVGVRCSCPGYLAPESPELERKPFVVVINTKEHLPLVRVRGGAPALGIPLAEYLADHPQRVTGPICTHCNYPIHSTRNPSGWCDHLNYPEYCSACMTICGFGRS